jgi:hypothetical protein
MRPVFLWGMLLLHVNGEVVDRIAITVDRQVITELQIDEDLRVTELLNQKPLTCNPELRREAADRLVAQLLVQREMEISHYTTPPGSQVEEYLGQVEKSFPNAAAYSQALQRYHVTEPVLKQHLATQLSTLSFIEIRFRPNLDVSGSEIEDAYKRELASWKADHAGADPPSFEAARPEILKTLTEEHTDRILDTWLEEARKQVSIIYLDKSLQ